MNSPSELSTSELVGQALSQSSTLIREEVRLARAELVESASKAAVAVGLLVGAIVICLVSLNVLAAALVAALTELGIAGGWSALIVGVLFAVVAYLMAQKGIHDLKVSNLAPKRAIDSVKRNAEAVKDVANE